MKQEELSLILESHKKWLNNEDGGIRANLRDADLSDADLRDANLSNANLWSTTGNQKEIITIQTDLWQIVYTKKVIQIGCQRHTIDEWFSFDEKEISDMDSKALEFWKKWKPILLLILEREN